MRPAGSSRSLPSVPQARQPYQMSVSDDGSVLRDSTPYRLPKIQQQLAHRLPRTERVTRSEPTDLDQLYKVDYVGSDRMEMYLSKRHKLPGPPYTISQRHRQEGIHMPTFQKVQFEPVLPCNRVVEANGHAELERSTSRTSLSTRDTVILGLGRHVAGTQQESPPAVDKHSAWRLSPHKHKNYDIQAIQGQTGPFSRDFVIHCNTPNSWLQMKLNKQKTSRR
ncbi:uncharacterized protein LOC119721236 [Patiria miniata]|uniref:Uncharacterized protein n=1 Tax=Patiria miniata TaxID=46514 RepID=A0A913Z5X8_PATMI|nr:uncharacterized protein LOC119721236 [Patiria miniata]